MEMEITLTFIHRIMPSLWIEVNKVLILIEWPKLSRVTRFSCPYNFGILGYALPVNRGDKNLNSENLVFILILVQFSPVLKP